MQTFKKGLKELIKLYSNEPSFFSKKRIESGFSFISGQIGMFYYLFTTPNMTITDIVLWTSIQFTIAGYLTNKTEIAKSK